MTGRERRKPSPPLDPVALRNGLTQAQLKTLAELEHFQWQLEFVRRPLFQDPIPMLVDRERRRCVALNPDGTLDEAPTVRPRGQRASAA